MSAAGEDGQDTAWHAWLFFFFFFPQLWESLYETHLSPLSIKHCLASLSYPWQRHVLTVLNPKPVLNVFAWIFSVKKKQEEKSQVRSVIVFVCEHNVLLYLTTPTQQNSSKGFAWRRPFDPECHRSQLAKTSSLPLFISVPFNFPPTPALMLQLHFRWEFCNHLFLKAPAA